MIHHVLKLPDRRLNGLRVRVAYENCTCDACRRYIQEGTDEVGWSNRIYIGDRDYTDGTRIPDGKDYLGRWWSELHFCSFECAEDYLGFTR